MASPEGDWLWHKFDEVLPSDVLLRIAAVKGPTTAISDDSIVWVGASDKRFSVRSAYTVCAKPRIGKMHGMVVKEWKGRIEELICMVYAGLSFEATQKFLNS
ncbi:hypothetical protein V6N13_036271 [Hibiscus sabdariffa]